MTYKDERYYRCASIYYRMMRDLGLQPREPFDQFIRNAVMLYLGYLDGEVVIGVDAEYQKRFLMYFDATYSVSDSDY